MFNLASDTLAVLPFASKITKHKSTVNTRSPIFIKFTLLPCVEYVYHK